MMKNSSSTDTILYLLYAVFIVSIFCSFRAISSICIASIIVAGFIKTKLETGYWWNRRLKNHFFLACCVFYAVQLITLLYATNVAEELKYLQTRTAVVFVPLAVCSSSFINPDFFDRLFRFYVYGLVSVLFYCLLVACHQYFSLHKTVDVFFYHALVSPFSQHAVHMSIYVFVAIAYLLQKVKTENDTRARRIQLIQTVLLAVFLLLLSSKLVIVLASVCIAYYCIDFARTIRYARWSSLVTLGAGLLCFGLVLFTHNPISKRFSEIAKGNIAMVEQPHFNQAIYFNGLQFRLLQWRFTGEILSERHAWLTGVADNAQSQLNKKYISTQMYTGDAGTGTGGYLGYNTHNEFLESILQAGVAGIFSFIIICITMIGLAVEARNTALTMVVCLLTAYAFNEAMLETQYGGTLFTLFPLLFYYGLRTRTITTDPINNPRASLPRRR